MQPVEGVLGVLLVGAAGWGLSTAMLGRGVDRPSKAAFAIVAGLFAPALLLLALNLTLGVKFNDYWNAACVYALVAASSIGYCIACGKAQATASLRVWRK